MIGIIGAMDEEVAILKSMIDVKSVESAMHVEFVVGTLHGKNVVLMKSGIGKVNVAVATTLLFERFDIEAVINTGSAGGASELANVLDVVVSDCVVYHDVDVTGFDYEHGQVPGMPSVFKSDEGLVSKALDVLSGIDGVNYFVGKIATGDAFVNRPEQLDVIKCNFPDVVAIEMEAAAVSHVCHLYETPVVIVRALSDIAGKESHLSFDEFLVKAAEASSRMVAELVKVMM